MQIDESRKLLLSDTLVPDIFITEYLPGLDGLAVKIYLYVLLTVRTNRNITEQDLGRRLGVEVDAVHAALLQLATVELIAIKDRSLEILDVKAAEIERAYRPKTASAPLEIIQAQEKFTVREKLMADIAKTFFQGLMSPAWYGEIDSWFDRYGFEPEVIYALFQECARRNKLDSKAYMAKVAENWSGRGIVTYNDLNRYFLAYDKVSKTSKKVGRKLRKTMTEYDEEIVARWIEQYGYEFEIIELALRKTTKMANPNLDFIDHILREWFEHQLRDGEVIRAYEAEKSGRLAAERRSKSEGQPGRAGQAGNKGNFAQREYSEDYLNSFYEEIKPDGEADNRENGPEAAASELPGQIGIAELLNPDAPPAGSGQERS